jgi:glycosyltransferase involved in cell wall biosynthesis
MAKFRRIVKSCDLVLAGNHFLGEQALKFTTANRVSVIPTVVELGRYPMKARVEARENLTIGWIGSAGTIHYLEEVLPALEEVARRFPQACLKVVCDRFFNSRSIRMIKKVWREPEEVGDLHSFDIGIMPLSDDLWAHGKCALKIVQYLAVGLPVVCSPVGMNRDIVKNGVNGFWAMGEKEWIGRLGILIEDGKLREQMGLVGRRIVEEGYSLETVGERLVGLLRGL